MDNNRCDDSPEYVIQSIKDQTAIYTNIQEKINFVSSIQNELDDDYNNLSPHQKYIEYRSYQKIKKELHTFKKSLIRDQCYINQTSNNANSPMLHTNNHNNSKSNLLFKLKSFFLCI